MAKRYVFWRTPTGSPHKVNDGKHAPTELLANFGRSASVAQDGGITRPLSVLLHNCEFAIRSAVVVIDPTGNEVNETDAGGIIWEAVRSEIKKSGGRKPLPQKDVIATADKLAASFFRERVASYGLITTLSVHSLPAKRIRVGDCEVIASAKRHAAYPFPGALKVQRYGEPFRSHLESSNYRTVKVKTFGRSVS